MEKKPGEYDPGTELKKGAGLTAASYDKTQRAEVTVDKVTVGGTPGVVEFSGTATGKGDGINGTIDLWLSIFRYMRPDGTIDHVSGWNIPLALRAGMSPFETAKAFETYINTGSRPYAASTSWDREKAALSITFKPEPRG